MQKLITLGEAAEILRISPNTARVWASSRKLPIIKIGRCVRVSPDALVAWIKEREEKVRLPELPKDRRPGKTSRFDSVLANMKDSTA